MDACLFGPVDFLKIFEGHIPKFVLMFAISLQAGSGVVWWCPEAGANCDTCSQLVKNISHLGQDNTES